MLCRWIRLYSRSSIVATLSPPLECAWFPLKPSELRRRDGEADAASIAVAALHLISLPWVSVGVVGGLPSTRTQGRVWW